MVQAPEKEKVFPQTPQTSEEESVLSRQETEVGSNLEELEGYLEKIEREPKKEPVLDEKGDQLLSPTDHLSPEITLPLSQVETKKALHAKIADSIRWLAEWCIRIGKKAIRR